MRIRRRQVPFLLPSFPPAPPSDLPLSPSPPVQHHNSRMPSPPHENQALPQPQTPRLRPPSPDQANQRVILVGAGSNGWDRLEMEEKDCLELGRDGEIGDERLRDGEKSNDSSKGSIFGADTASGVLPFSSSSDRVGMRWCEGEKAFPLKKRRGSFERGGAVTVNQETIIEKEKKMKAKMKTKMNKKCVQEKDDEDHGSEREAEQGFDGSLTAASAAAAATTGSAKKRSRGGALMEGSRCSRVNGRGWRCCQQTLVGYSLCEHHLGKGRLRSMSSVRSRAVARNQNQELSNPLSQLPRKNHEQEHSDLQEYKAEAAADDVKPFTGGAKKRLKIGMVKARSLSSLLGQPSSAVAVAADDNKYEGDISCGGLSEGESS